MWEIDNAISAAENAMKQLQIATEKMKAAKSNYEKTTPTPNARFLILGARHINQIPVNGGINYMAPNYAAVTYEFIQYFNIESDHYIEIDLTKDGQYCVGKSHRLDCGYIREYKSQTPREAGEGIIDLYPYRYILDCKIVGYIFKPFDGLQNYLQKKVLDRSVEYFPIWMLHRSESDPNRKHYCPNYHFILDESDYSNINPPKFAYGTVIVSALPPKEGNLLD